MTHAILYSMSSFTFWLERPFLLFAIVVVLLGGVLFLMLPIVVGTDAGTVFPVSSVDHISSWTWTGVYKDGATKQAATEQEIARLKGMVGKQGAETYDLYVGIAGQYELLGDGASSYRYLGKAIKEDGKRGLAYMNMGHLMESLGAFTTAGIAYDRAVALEPNNPVFVNTQRAFRTNHPVAAK